MNPITLTEAAVTHIKSMLQKNPQNVGFRLSIKKTGCSGLSYVPTVIEKTVAGDSHFDVQGLPVFIDPVCLPYLQNVLIDYVVEEGPGLKQKKLVFINPNEKGRCGCGESFTVE